MKSLFLFLCFCATTSVAVYPEIKNGYEQHIMGHRLSLKRLCEILKTKNDLSNSGKKKIKSQIQELMTFITHYEMTERMLAQFKEIAPDLHYRINSLRDINGYATDVYVKFIPVTQAPIQAKGMTSLGHALANEDTYSSVYGDRTVSVTICVARQSLWILAHEFGHVYHQVRNLSSYTKYYKRNYSGASTNPNFIGHNIDDPSGKEAINFEKQFRKAFSNYCHYEKEVKLVSPINLMASIRENLATVLELR